MENLETINVVKDRTEQRESLVKKANMILSKFGDMLEIEIDELGNVIGVYTKDKHESLPIYE